MIDWNRGQDAVFANCADGNLVLPLAAPAGSSALLKADRAYQMAAAQFYAGNFEQARVAFEAIANDVSSPWQGIAGYVAARCLVRQAFLSRLESGSGTTASFDPALMRQAAEALRTLLKEKAIGVSKVSIQDELNLVRLRAEPIPRVHELASALSGPKSDPNYEQHLQDLTWFLNVHLDDLALREDAREGAFLAHDQMKKVVLPTTEMREPKFNQTYLQLSSIRSSETLVDWLITSKSPAIEAKDHAFAEWGKTRQIYWLIAALTKAVGTEPNIGDLIAAAQAVNVSSPAWESLTYHRARLLIATDKAGVARTLLDQVLPEIRATERDSSINAYVGLRMRASLDLAEFLHYAPRKILLQTSESQSSVNECLEVMKDPKRKYDCVKVGRTF